MTQGLPRQWIRWLGASALLCGCGGRTGLDMPEPASLAGASGASASANGGASNGGAPATEGRASGGAPATGGRASGGAAGTGDAAGAGGADPSGGAGGSGPSCDPDQLACPMGDGLSCVNVRRDATNCGACGRECVLDAYCDDGRCRALPCTGALLLGGLPLVDVGGEPIGVALVDLDADEHLDLVTGTLDADVPLALNLGLGGGLFSSWSSPASAAEDQPSSVLVVDVDGDEELDLVVTDTAANKLRIHYTAGTQSNVFLDTGDGPTGSTSGDFDGNGWLDFAVLNAVAGSVTVLLHGEGPFVFDAGVDYPTPAFPQALVAGDVNGDDQPDLVLASLGDDAKASAVSVFIGEPDGTFDTRVDYPTYGGTRSVALADLDRDGRLDVVHGNYETSSLGFLFSAPGGTLVSGGELAMDSPPVFVAVGDLNHDDWPDVVTANEHSTVAESSVSVFVAAGSGAMAYRQDLLEVNNAAAVALGDLTDDGHVDLAVANRGWQAISVLVGAGDGAFSRLEDYATEEGPVSVAIAELDEDGAPDLAIAHYTSQSVGVHLGGADDALAQSAVYAAAGAVRDLAAADLNGDGQLDLAIASQSPQAVGVLLGSGAGTFAPVVSYPVVSSPYIFSGPTAIVAGDLDGNGALDLVTANYVTENIPSNVSVLLGAPDGTFAPHAEYGTQNGPLDVAIGDLTGDQIPDLVVAHGYSCSTLLLPGIGDGTFAPGNDVSWVCGLALAVGDLDGDGLQDLVIASDYGVSVLLGLPDGTLAQRVDYAASIPGRPNSVVIADLDVDGIPDLVVGTAENSAPDKWGTVNVLRGNGDGTFAPRVAYVAGSAPTDLAVGDLDDDGRPEVAVTNHGTNSVTILRNSCQ
ncbi:MAG: VCBS repeat-containing protein [Polyangiaceae bacterium]|nr:VCBS repeat-containing protein [Polyangiaceae bacterium]